LITVLNRRTKATNIVLAARNNDLNRKQLDKIFGCNNLFLEIILFLFEMFSSLFAGMLIPISFVQTFSGFDNFKQKAGFGFGCRLEVSYAVSGNKGE
jgi:hypothetical protein